MSIYVCVAWVRVVEAIANTHACRHTRSSTHVFIYLVPICIPSLAGRELCSVINGIIRSDRPDDMVILCFRAIALALSLTFALQNAANTWACIPSVPSSPIHIQVHAIVVIAGINRIRRMAASRDCVSAKSNFSSKFPPNGISWRGGGFRNQYCSFYVQG